MPARCMYFGNKEPEMINSTVSTQNSDMLKNLQKQSDSGKEALPASDGQKSAQATGRAAFGAGEAYVANSPYNTVPQMHSQPTEDTVTIGGTEMKRSTVKNVLLTSAVIGAVVGIPLGIYGAAAILKGKPVKLPDKIELENFSTLEEGLKFAKSLGIDCSGFEDVKTFRTFMERIISVRNKTGAPLPTSVKYVSSGKDSQPVAAYYRKGSFFENPVFKMEINKDYNVDDFLNDEVNSLVHDGKYLLLTGNDLKNCGSADLKTLYKEMAKYAKDPGSLTHDQKIKLAEQLSIYYDKCCLNPTFIYDTMVKQGIKKVEGTDISYTLKDVEKLMNDAFSSERSGKINKMLKALFENVKEPLEIGDDAFEYFMQSFKSYM